MRTRPRVAAMTAAVAAGLVVTGCTGIPTGGKVHAGAPKGAASDVAQVQAPPQPPVDGEAPGQVADGFRQASADAADLSVARAYLADAKWQPSEGVRVIDEPEAPSVASMGDEAKVTYTDKWLGTIAPDGTYQPKKQGTTFDSSYQLSKVKGQWRIVDPPGFSVATVSGVDDFYDADYLYFVNQRGQLLVPIQVFLPTLRDAATQLVQRLLQGPPKWLRDAGVVSAIPPGSTLVDPVSEDNNDVVTVNLSAEFASLSAAERAAASAQIVYTLQHFGGGRFKIEAAGQLVPGGPQSTKTLSAFDSDTLKTDSFYYAGPDGGTYSSSGAPVAGDAGLGVIDLTTPVVAPKLSDTPGGALVAGIVKENGSQTLYVGPLSAPKRVMSGASFTTPSWDAFGDVWTVRQAGTTSGQQVLVSAVTQSGTTKFVTVADPELTAASDLVESLKVSRDGTRVAVIARSTESGPQVLVGHITKTDQGESISGFYPVASSLVPQPDGIAWASSTTLDVLGTSAGATNTVWSVDVDGWQQTQTTTPPFGIDVVAIAAAPNQPLVVETRGGEIEVDRGGSWQIVGAGSNPSYPG